MRFDTRFHHYTLCGLTAVSFAAPSLAVADVTADDVWADLTKQYSAYGYTMEGDPTRVGDALIIYGMSLMMDFPEDEGTLSFTADKIVLNELGDGRVSIEFPDKMPIGLSIKPEDEKPVDITLEYRFTDLSLVASGAVDDLTYDFAAADMAIELTDLAVNNVSLGNNIAYFLMSMADVSGTAKTATQDGFAKLAEDLAAASMTYEVNFADPETGDTGAFSGTLNDIAFTMQSNVPEGPDPSDLQAGIAAGLSGGGSFAYGSGQSQFKVASTKDGNSSGESSSEGGQFAVNLSADGMVFESETKGLQMGLVPQGMPFPVSFAAETSGMTLKMPVTESDAEQPFALSMILGGVEVSEMIWAMVDPQAALPRDPMTVDMALSGTVLSSLNLFDVEAMEALENAEEAPGELRTLTLDRLNVSAVGAQLTGDGAFSFDNTDLETFDGMPRPNGKVTLNLTGANALLDKLGDLGMIGPDDLMGARMMLGMFTIPQGNDSVTTTLEVNEQGHVIANGQRIQ